MAGGGGITEQGKVHQVARRALNCQEDAESLERQSIARKVPSDQEGVKQRGGHRVARRLLCSLLEVRVDPNMPSD